MILQADSVLVFDLDDTLYSERSFERSGKNFVFGELSRSADLEIIGLTVEQFVQQQDWISLVLNYPELSAEWSKEDLLTLYRNHFPEIQLYPDALRFLTKHKTKGHQLALVTDGRALTQRNKIAALGLVDFFELIVISEEVGSEKPALQNFEMVERQCPGKRYWYFGDNVKKDFYGPKLLGWQTVGLLSRGENVHPQNIDVSVDFLPDHWIKDFDAVEAI